MEQYFKDFIISGTADKTFSVELENRIVEDGALCLFDGEASYASLAAKILEYGNEVRSSNLGTYESANDLERLLVDLLNNDYSAVKHLAKDINQFYCIRDMNEVTVSKMPGLIEINNYSGVVFDRHSIPEANRFVDFVVTSSKITSVLSFLQNNKDKIRVFTKILKVNNRICNLQSRFVHGNTRIIYNHFYKIRTSDMTKLEVIDKKYKLDIIRTNNFTTTNLYPVVKDDIKSNNVGAIIFGKITGDDRAGLVEIINKFSPRTLYAVSSVLNKNQMMISKLSTQILEAKKDKDYNYEDGTKVTNMVLINGLGHLLGKQSKPGKMSRHNVIVATTAILAAGLGLNVMTTNAKLLLSGNLTNISKDEITRTISLMINNVKAEENIEDYKILLNDALLNIKRIKATELTDFKNNYKEQIASEIYVLLKEYLIRARDLVLKTMYDENTGIFFKAPKDLESRITIVSAINSIDLVVDKKNGFKLSSLDSPVFISTHSSRRDSKNIAEAIAHATSKSVMELNKEVIIPILEQIDVKIEELISKIEGLTVEDVCDYENNFKESQFKKTYE